MGKSRSIEILVGCFVLAGIIAIVFLALKVSGLTNFVDNDTYIVSASFDNIGDLKARAPVTIAGVRVGQVAEINLDPKTFAANVVLRINDKYNDIPVDSSARILTEGLLGSNYISITPGFDNNTLKNQGQIQQTHSALILENLIGQLLFKVNNTDDDKKASDDKPKLSS